MGGDLGGSREQLEARLQMLQKKVDVFRAPGKQAARARLFRSIGKVHQSLQELASRDGDGHGITSGSSKDDGCGLSWSERPSKKAKKAKEDNVAADVAAESTSAPAAPMTSRETRRKMKQLLEDDDDFYLFLQKQQPTAEQADSGARAAQTVDQGAACRSEGLTPSDYTHTNLGNAFVRSGDIQGAKQQLVAMQDAGATPNVVTYTALIKGVCSAGDIKGAEELLARMAAQRPPMLPNLRTINALLVYLFLQKQKIGAKLHIYL